MASLNTMDPVTTAGSKEYPVLSRREIEGMIAAGGYIIILDQKVLRIDGWVKYHPGGQKVLQHLIGKDATDEVTV